MPSVPNRRPQLRIVAPAASPEEAAAVGRCARALHARDRSRPLRPLPPPVSGWVQAARQEAVEREPRPGPWL